MAALIGLQIEINGQQRVVSSVGDLKKILREAQFEALKISQQFGETSKEALAASKQIAQLKDQIKDASERVDLFDPGKKFQVFSNAISTAAGGLTALQGAMGLFGTESEEVQKQLLKVQSALALSQGLSVIADGAKDFQRLAGVIRSQVVTAFSTLRGAIIATGIGALVVGLGLLVANFEKVKETVLNLIPGLGRVADFIGKVVTKITDFVGVTSDATRELEKLKVANEAITKSIDNQIKILEAQGGKEEDIYRLKLQRIERERNELLDTEKTKGKLSKDEIDRLVSLNTDLAVLDAQETARRKKLLEDRKKDNEDAAFELSQQQQQALKDQYAKDEEAYLKRKKLREKEQDEIKTFGVIKAENDAVEKSEEEKRQEKFNERIEILNNGTLGRFLMAKAAETVANNNANESKKKSDQAYLDSKKVLTQMEIELLFSLSDVIGRQTALGKGLAIAAATINTYQAASEALKANYGVFGPAAAVARFVAVAATIANGLKQVRAIASVQVPGSGGGGAVGAPSISANSPLQPTQIGANQVTLDQRSINAIGAPVRAYVVERDITGSQNRNRRIERQTRFG